MVSAISAAVSSASDLAIPWARYPRLCANDAARTWLAQQADWHARNTILAYARALENYLVFCALHRVDPEHVTADQVADYVQHHMSCAFDRRRARSGRSDVEERRDWTLATRRVRLTPVRLYYDYLHMRGLCTGNPFRWRGIALHGWLGLTAEHAHGRRRAERIWLPSEEQWQVIMEMMRVAPVRNRLLLALAYDGALRSSELCSVELADFELERRQLLVRGVLRAATRHSRVVAYSSTTAQLYQLYLGLRPTCRSSRLFMSASLRTLAQPIAVDTWHAVMRQIREVSGLRKFGAPTLRHLRLTDLACAGWDAQALATFAAISRPTAQAYLFLARQRVAAGAAAGESAGEGRLSSLLLPADNRPSCR